MPNKKKRKIQTKLTLAMLTVILILSAASILIFHYLSRAHLHQEARAQLKTEGNLLVKTLRQGDSETLLSKLMTRKDMKLLGKSIDSYLVVYDGAGKLLYTNISKLMNHRVTLRQLMKDKNLLIEKFEVQRQDGVTLRMIMAADLAELNDLNRMIRRTELIAMSISAAVASFLAYLFSRSISKPLRLMSAKLRSYKPGAPLPKISVQTRDELEELAESYHLLTERIVDTERRQLQFLQNASHELKTPLMSIQGHAEMIKDGIVAMEEAEESLHVIISECQRLKTIVDELTYLTKLENVEETFRFHPSSLNEVVRASVLRLSTLAETRNLKMQMEESQEVVISLDPEKLARAFMNILSNAVRYAESTITIHLRQPHPSYIELLFTDDGPGFSPGESKKIFERFYKGNQGVTGIGLSITRRIIEAHAGSIEAYNQEPHGAVLRITLPIKHKT